MKFVSEKLAAIDHLMQTHEAARVVGLHPETLKRMRREGSIPKNCYVFIDCALRWDPKGLADWVLTLNQNIPDVVPVRGGNYCPKCGMSNPPEWHDDAECRIVIQEHAHASHRAPIDLAPDAENIDLSNVEEL